MIGRDFGPEQHWNIAAAAGYPDEFEVVEDLSEIMHHRPFYDEGNIEAMNILTDRIQGPTYKVPQWLPATRFLLHCDPRSAFLKAFGCLVCDLDRFLKTLEEKAKRPPQLLF